MTSSPTRDRLIAERRRQADQQAQQLAENQLRSTNPHAYFAQYELSEARVAAGLAGSTQHLVFVKPPFTDGPCQAAVDDLRAKGYEVETRLIDLPAPPTTQAEQATGVYVRLGD